MLIRRIPGTALLVALAALCGCVSPATTLTQREAFFAKVNARAESVTFLGSNSVNAFAGVIVDAAVLAADAGEGAPFAADLLATVFLPRTIKGGPFTFTTFRGERPGKLQRPIAFDPLRAEDLAPPLRANVRHLARHVAGALRFPALIHWQTDNDRRQLKAALRQRQTATTEANRRRAQRLVDERRSEIAQDLAALVILHRFDAFFRTPIPPATLQHDIARALGTASANSRLSRQPPPHHLARRGLRRLFEIGR